MKSKLVLCSMILGCSIGLMAQQSSAPGSGSGTTPPTFARDQSQQQTMVSHPGQIGTRSPLGSNSTVNTQDEAAQTSSPTGQMGPTNSDQRQRVEGCLGGTDGNFTLTDKAGMTYQLQGENSELAKHIGHEVRIMGMESAAGSTSASPSSENTISVQKVKMISDSCSSSQGAGSSPKQ